MTPSALVFAPGIADKNLTAIPMTPEIKDHLANIDDMDSQGTLWVGVGLVQKSPIVNSQKGANYKRN